MITELCNYLLLCMCIGLHIKSSSRSIREGHTPVFLWRSNRCNIWTIRKYLRSVRHTACKNSFAFDLSLTAIISLQILLNCKLLQYILGDLTTLNSISFAFESIIIFYKSDGTWLSQQESMAPGINEKHTKGMVSLTDSTLNKQKGKITCKKISGREA